MQIVLRATRPPIHTVTGMFTLDTQKIVRLEVHAPAVEVEKLGGDGQPQPAVLLAGRRHPPQRNGLIAGRVIGTRSKHAFGIVQQATCTMLALQRWFKSQSTTSSQAGR